MKIRLIFLVLVFLGAVRSSAQSVFVEGSAFAGIERRTRSEVSTAGIDVGGNELGSMDGTVAGGGVAIGTWLSPRVTVRLELGFPSSLEASQEANVIPAGASTLFFSRSIEASERLRSAATLVGYHTARRHGVQLGYIGGAVFLFARQHLKYTTSYPPITVMPSVLALPATVLTVPALTVESTTTSYTVTAEAGIDADISLHPRISIVPQLRLIGFDGGVSIRPGAALRASW